MFKNSSGSASTRLQEVNFCACQVYSLLAGVTVMTQYEYIYDGGRGEGGV